MLSEGTSGLTVSLSSDVPFSVHLMLQTRIVISGTLQYDEDCIVNLTFMFTFFIFTGL